MDAEEFWQEAKNEHRDSGFNTVKVLHRGTYYDVRLVYADWADTRSIIVETAEAFEWEGDS